MLCCIKNAAVQVWNIFIEGFSNYAHLFYQLLDYENLEPYF